MIEARLYFRNKLNELGYKEWQDGFNFENIPLTLLNKSYHIETNRGTGTRLNQYDLEHEQTLTLRFFLKGYRNPAQAVDEAHVEIEKILKKILLCLDRVTQPRIKNISYNNYLIEKFDDSNDNSLIVTLEFTILNIMEV